MKRPARLHRMPAYPFARWAGHVEAARQRGLGVIRLDIGDPDLPPPEEVAKTLCQSAHETGHHSGWT